MEQKEFRSGVSCFFVALSFKEMPFQILSLYTTNGRFFDDLPTARQTERPTDQPTEESTVILRIFNICLFSRRVGNLCESVGETKSAFFFWGKRATKKYREYMWGDVFNRCLFFFHFSIVYYCVYIFFLFASFPINFFFIEDQNRERENNSKKEEQKLTNICCLTFNTFVY